MNITFDLPQKEYYQKAIESIPEDHTHRDEIVSLLIDQVIDDSYGYSTPNSSTGSSGEGPD